MGEGIHTVETASSPVSTAITSGVARRPRVDAPDARVSVRGAHEARVGLAGQVDVIAVAARATSSAHPPLGRTGLPYLRGPRGFST